MQQIATKIFMTSSIIFGVTGMLIVFLGFQPGAPDTYLTGLLIRILMLSVFVILSSFAISVACKYLIGDVRLGSSGVAEDDK